MHVQPMRKRRTGTDSSQRSNGCYSQKICHIKGKPRADQLVTAHPGCILPAEEQAQEHSPVCIGVAHCSSTLWSQAGTASLLQPHRATSRPCGSPTTSQLAAPAGGQRHKAQPVPLPLLGTASLACPCRHQTPRVPRCSATLWSTSVLYLSSAQPQTLLCTALTYVHVVNCAAGEGSCGRCEAQEVGATGHLRRGGHHQSVAARRHHQRHALRTAGGAAAVWAAA